MSPVSFQARRLQRQFVRAGLRSEKVTLRTGTVSYWEGGSGPPLLLIAGFGGSALWQWYPQVKALRRHHRLIIPDLLFFGESHTGRAEPSLRSQALAMVELLDHIGVSKTHILGLSYGGFVAYAMASEWPDRVRNLILNNSPGPVMGRNEVQDLLRRYGVSRVHDLFLPARGEEIRRLLDVAWHRAPRVPKWVLRDAHRVLYRNQLDAKHQLLTELISQVETPEALAMRIESQTLILWGAHDPVFPLHLAHRLRRHLGSGARVQVVPKAAHAPNLERPRAFNKHVLEFLAS